MSNISVNNNAEEMPPRKVIIVDDNITNLTAAKDAIKGYYKVYLASSAAVFFSILKKNTPDLVLLDIEMPIMNGYETLIKFYEEERYKDIPVIFLTAKGDEGSELQGFELGAVDYISKPFSPALLRKRIENQLLILQQKETIKEHANDLKQLVIESGRDILRLQNAILQTVADLVEFRDSFTGGHTTNTVYYLEALIQGMIEKGLYSDLTIDWNMDFILPSALLHDVGKIAVSDSVLNRPQEMLNTNELKELKSHVAIGVEAVEKVLESIPNNTFLIHALNMTSAHHERWNGTGYPKGLIEDEIPLEGRLMAIVDAYDEMISWRPFKKSFSHEEAMKIIKRQKGIYFDPALVDIFIGIGDKIENITRKTKARDGVR